MKSARGARPTVLMLPGRMRNVNGMLRVLGGLEHPHRHVTRRRAEQLLHAGVDDVAVARQQRLARDLVGQVELERRLASRRPCRAGA